MRAPTGGEMLAPLIAAVSIAFLAVAAAGAGAEIGGTAGVPNAPTGVLVAAEWLGGFLLLGLAATTAAILLLIRPRHRKRPEEDYEPYIEPRKLSLAARLTLIVLAALTIAGTVIAVRAAWPSTHAATSQPGLLRPPPPGPATRVASNRVPHLPPFPWGWFALAAAVVVLLVGAALVMSNMRRVRTLPISHLRGERGHRGDDDTLAEAATHAEPRLAVRLAYAFMRQTLAARGVDSEDSDAPGEYARRVSGVLPDLVDPIVQLTQLYERARFSSLEVGEDAKRSALASLSALRPEESR